MSDIEDKKWELIDRYIEAFDEGPPVWKVPDERAVAMMEAALKEGKPIRDDNDVLPPDVLT